MTRIAILDDYQQVAPGMADWKSLPAQCECVFFTQPFANASEVAQALRDFDIVCLMRERTPFPRSLFEALPRLRCLVTTGPRNSAVDVAAAQERGVVVCGTRGGPSGHTTAELAWALILAVSRHLVVEDRRLREGLWQGTLGSMLHGKTLGLLGLGRTGERMAAIGAAFGMTPIAWSQNLTEARAREAGARWVDKNTLMQTSDVLSLHLVLSPRTQGIVGADDLARMQPHAILINTARAGLVDEAALIDALVARRIAGAGIDVFGQEPLPRTHPFIALDNVVLSPHLGYVTQESYRLFYHDVVEDIAAFLGGAPIRVLAPAT
ncbi:MAG: D-2-hydroxyacid dehydrogenase family protein [Burkholderiaceae bacterium]|nr:D-2-hydroxyacid dehydrogenase family protein [Burkholderiaceae bacterium]MDO9090137.1 D-2-hydroxyacid dehydrogenase family protein [Burkholderiaceae bacterium]